MRPVVTRTESEALAVAHISLDNDIRYGRNGASWLPSPASVQLDPAEWAAIGDDLGEVWRWYRTWNDIYCESLRGEAEPSIAALVEFGLKDHEVPVQREFARLGTEPVSCRVEYVYAHDRRYIAEVQWVSGGLGLFSGIDWAYDAVSPGPAGRRVLADGLLDAFAHNACGAPGVLSVVRDDWLPGEEFLSRFAERRGIPFTAIDRARCADVLSAPEVPAGLIYGQGYTSFVPAETFTGLARDAIARRFVPESPYNHIYRQKWGLALVHDPLYAHRFSERLRSLIPASVLLNDESPRFDLLGAVDDAFERVSTLPEVVDLPERVRKSLIIKSGAGVGGFHSNGRGVFRLGGSRLAARKVVDFVRERIALGEPWILQPFLSVPMPMPLASGPATGAFTECDTHLKLMVFGARSASDGASGAVGALVNYGRHWKVGGRSPRLDAAGRQEGTAFTDVVVGDISTRNVVVTGGAL
jgi:hypothetical protein